MAKRLIDAAEIENLFYAQVEHGATDLMDAFDDALQDAPTVEAVEVVRCQDCRYAKFESKCSKYYCLHFPECFRYANDFCSYGERKEG